MKITFATFGTRGDTEPFRIIADVLVDRGHEVLILTDEQNIEDFSCTKANVEGVVDSKETKNVFINGILLILRVASKPPLLACGNPLVSRILATTGH